MRQKIDRFILLMNTITKKLYEEHNIKKILAYLIFGGLTTIINILVYSLCIKIDIHYLISNIIAFILSIIFSYFTNKKWVFNHLNKISPIANEFAKFLGCRIFTLLLESIILYAFVSLLDFNKYGVKIFANVIVIVLNYILSEFIVFKNREIDKGADYV